MSSKVTDTTAQGQIQFIQNNQTSLDAGKYKITVKQTVTINNQEQEDSPFTSNLTFVVQGNRFELKPEEIHAVFPPAGSFGDHSHVLPHIALKSSTLPWERLAQSGNQNVPWLALIIIHEEEKLLRTIQKETILEATFYNSQNQELTQDKKEQLWQHLLSSSIGWIELIDDEAGIVDKSNRKSENLEGDFTELEAQVEAILAQSGNTKITTLKKLQQPSTSTIKWPGVTLETGQQQEDKVSVIDVPKKLLSEILSTTKDLEYLAHVRQVTGDTENSEPLSLVISNRLPKKEGISTAYLISLENRYNNNGEFNYQNATDENYIRLVVVKSWSFSCTEPEQNFTGLLKNLNKDTLKLPTQNNPQADQYFTKGYLPLPHYLRQGGKTFSWYHSPLVPGENPTNLSLSQLSVRSADQLIAYNPNTGLFDISYAAAWQLGQLLALQDQKFATSLFNWKRTNAQKLAQNNQQELFPHLFPEQDSNSTDNDFPQDIKTWFEQLGLLSGIPFNYLVPDEQMLPSESIRFFWLDWFWVESLLDGAFSIGRVQDSDVQQDSNNNPLTGAAKQITGFLMRSEVVSGWPDLQIDGSESSITGDQAMVENQKLNILRRDRISEDVLICLFDGEIRTVDIYLKPEGLHFGFNNDDANNLWRELRKLDGTEMSNWKVQPVPWKDENQTVVNIDDLANKIKEELKIQHEINDSAPFTAAQFALQMVQGAEKLRLSMAE
ncbi:MAG: hypothetical protein SAK29_18450 [Scytonema sp. PMC 1069.18]|nr:hypothetical protein [Scytonema sp. PMC 1069.18]MEC4882035.1 hypothetical protein [Scytonema sp. PMC 1070.18]